jgi:methylated-DNA-[protein]-cysteine S-methyltransferase
VAETVRYEAEGWGVGELWLEADTLLWHELPRQRGWAGVHRPHARGWAGVHRPNSLAERVKRHFAGARDTFADVTIDLDGYTTFQRAVVETLRNIPWGEVVTYGELAALAGYPNAQRAAGSVCAHNRFPLVVPCHRVVAANGIGRYGAGGVEYKRRLLELEGVFL